MSDQVFWILMGVIALVYVINAIAVKIHRDKDRRK